MNTIKTYTIKLGNQISFIKPQTLNIEGKTSRIFSLLKKEGRALFSKINELFNPANEGNPYM